MRTHFADEFHRYLLMASNDETQVFLGNPYCHHILCRDFKTLAVKTEKDTISSEHA